MKIVKILSPVRDLIHLLEKSGGLVILTGGSVRDILLNEKSNFDIDLEVYYLENKDLEEILQKSKYKFLKTGKSFLVYKLVDFNVDLSLPRFDVKFGDKHKDFKVYSSCYCSFKQASYRRDLTVNSLGYCLKLNMFLDPRNHIHDIANKLIRPVSFSCFKEDELRILRAAQLASRFEMKIDDEILDSWQDSSIENLSTERIKVEMVKLLNSKNPSIGLKFLNKIKILDYLKIKINENILDLILKSKSLEIKICILVSNSIDNAKFICEMFGKIKLAKISLIIAHFINNLDKLSYNQINHSLYLIYLNSEDLALQIKEIFKIKTKFDFKFLSKLINGKILIKLKSSDQDIKTIGNVLEQIRSNIFNFEKINFENLKIAYENALIDNKFNLDKERLFTDLKDLIS